MVVVGLVCFAVLGALAASAGSSAEYTVVLGVGGLLIGLATRMVLVWLLGTLNPELRRDKGTAAIAAAVDQSLLLLVPFTVMAAIARLGLGWEAAIVFTSAALMTSAGTAGAEVARLGGRRVPLMVVPVVMGMAATMLWSLGVANASEIVSGAGG